VVVGFGAGVVVVVVGFGTLGVPCPVVAGVVGAGFDAAGVFVPVVVFTGEGAAAAGGGAAAGCSAGGGSPAGAGGGSDATVTAGGISIGVSLLSSPALLRLRTIKNVVVSAPMSARDPSPMRSNGGPPDDPRAARAGGGGAGTGANADGGLYAGAA
jgi:hypothetical protein